MQKRKLVLKPGTRIYFTSQLFNFARWFGTATVHSYDPDREEYVTDRDPGTVLDKISPLRQTWPAHYIRPSRYQLDSANEDQPMLVGPTVAARAAELGFKRGVHFESPYSYDPDDEDG